MIRVYSQRHWPGAGDVDDCVPVSTFMALHACAPWLDLPGVGRFREAAGVPDRPGITGMTVLAAMRAIGTLYPAIARLAVVTTSMIWAEFVGQVKLGHVATVTVKAGSLPARLQHGWAGGHQVTVGVDDAGAWWIADPLAAPHTRPEKIEQAELRNAVRGYNGDQVSAILMPTFGAAFGTTPLHTAVVKAAAASEFKRQQAGARVTLAPLAG